MIAEKIAGYVLDKGIRQSHLCKKTGMTKQGLCMALQGKRKLSIDEYAKICNALDLPLAYFFEFDRQQKGV